MKSGEWNNKEISHLSNQEIRMQLKWTKIWIGILPQLMRETVDWDMEIDIKMMFHLLEGGQKSCNSHYRTAVIHMHSFLECQSCNAFGRQYTLLLYEAHHMITIQSDRFSNLQAWHVSTSLQPQNSECGGRENKDFTTLGYISSSSLGCWRL